MRKDRDDHGFTRRAGGKPTAGSPLPPTGRWRGENGQAASDAPQHAVDIGGWQRELRRMREADVPWPIEWVTVLEDEPAVAEGGRSSVNSER